MKNILLILSISFIACKSSNRTYLRPIKNNLKNSKWELVENDSLSKNAKKEYSIFRDFRYSENSLICYQQFNNNWTDYVCYYFTYSNGKTSICGCQTSHCSEFIMKNDTIKILGNDLGDTIIIWKKINKLQ